MAIRSCLWYVAVSLLLSVSKCSEVVDLNTANFEHLTQASTGHTTGDWLVKVEFEKITLLFPERM